MDMDIVDILLIPFLYVANAGERLFWIYLLVAVAIGLLAYFAQIKAYGKSSIAELFSFKKLKDQNRLAIPKVKNKSSPSE